MERLDMLVQFEEAIGTIPNLKTILDEIRGSL
jgi:hypothetical protein